MKSEVTYMFFGLYSGGEGGCFAKPRTARLARAEGSASRRIPVLCKTPTKQDVIKSKVC